ncbi:LapA family protein [Geodermatophilus obscurus]|uniref:Lipopolysaccharide assembly protein A domain-containing protein n=1 Tax=Geodermatophilus obscurus (strain ATCC 25078 / DSM 43160 / JCM 3152 / CCUG 61914 / KCC A-0152 / KCTC 9177 / NBRC 13315 / NRRL B-3577 / G-20) TaxID=526225 RepID=D2S5W1_GEOOG|nr:LapA family protein [Geodermatophilus obscurus]ADB77367.1 hypothetical protein Gobs_4831 [Geodermatophilus obscurus DSM 43160]
MTTPGSDPLRTSTGTPGTTTGPATAGPATTGGTARPERHPVRNAGRTLALALLLFVTVLLVLFVVYNTQTVEISLVFADVQAPLVLALVIAAALGGLLVGLAGLVLRARRRSS